MRLRQHREDALTERLLSHLASADARNWKLSLYETKLRNALRAGMPFVHADLWVRQATLTPEERELLKHLSMGFEPLRMLLHRLEDIGRLTDPRQRVILAAIREGCKDPYQIQWYLKLFGPPIVTEAA